LETSEGGWIAAQCPTLPGCVSQGRDEKEALENIKEAITAWLWALSVAQPILAVLLAGRRTRRFCGCGF
jgi:predicted RNase H-like HicB family nuclease